MVIEIRAAMQGDLASLTALARRTIRASYPAFLGAAVVDDFVESGASDQYVATSFQTCEVIVADGVLVGFAVTKANVIDLMMIDFALHRHGLGGRLLTHVEARLFREYDELTLESFEDNERANAFYRKHGWSQVRRFVEDGTGLRKLLFQKSKAG